MLALNKLPKKTGMSAYIRFNKIKYLQSRAIAILLSEKLSTEDLIRNHSNILIRGIKSANEKVIDIKALEHWQKLKMNRMFLTQYQKKEKQSCLAEKLNYLQKYN